MTQIQSQALTLFSQVVELEPRERAAKLARLERDQPDVHRLLVELLASDAAVERGDYDPDLLEPPLEVFAHLLSMQSSMPESQDPRIGSQLGPWRIDHLISHGGMGTVYEASRADGQYQQRAALKCLRGELRSPRVIDSLLRERETLAALDHPGIATLLDGGIDQDGCPWFAMRYVQGAQIDSWCDARRATLRERVALLVQACDALAFAHQRLMLHQDIKPSNLMVSDEGQVRLLDFGLTASLADASNLPRVAASTGYTAPEALGGATPAVTMDIWSMGMVMHILLSGQLPNALPSLLTAPLHSEGKTSSSLSQLAAQQPDVVAHARGLADAQTLAGQLAGDLDAIAARAIARDPQDRYASITAFRDDLQAWLQTRPVSARKGGMLYRSGRFLARHKYGAAAAMLVSAALLGVAGYTFWQERQASQQAAAQQALAQVFEQTLGIATLSGLGDTSMSSDSLLQETERQVRALPLQDHPDTLARGLSVLARNYVTIGNYSHATRLAREASSLQGDGASSKAASHATLASLLNLQGKPAEALQVAQQGLAVPDMLDVSTRLQLMTEIARGHWDLTDHDQARQALDEALALAEGKDQALAQSELLTLRGQWRMQLMDFRGADADLHRATDLALPDHPLVANEARHLAALSLLMQERTAEGRILTEHLLTDYRSRLGHEHPLVGRTLRMLANLQCANAELDTCAQTIALAEHIVRQRYGEQHPEFADVLRVRSFLNVFGHSQAEDGITLLRRAEALLLSFYPEDHYNVLRIRFMLSRRLLFNPVATTLEQKRNLADSITLMESVLAGFAQGRLPTQPMYRINLAQGLIRRGRDEDLGRAQGLLLENESLMGPFPPAYSWRFYNRYLLARLAFDRHALEQADALSGSILASLQQHQGPTNNRFALRDLLMLRAMIALERGDKAGAHVLLAQASAHMDNAFGSEHVGAVRTRNQLHALERTGTFSLLN